ncbi:MAG: hypothetical protein LBJ38_00835 [Oscillospiraceae bacterium]|jgi:archaellin|nr:hypothetical protein [Oscillospiraceae bacterium]
MKRKSNIFFAVFLFVLFLIPRVSAEPGEETNPTTAQLDALKFTVTATAGGQNVSISEDETGKTILKLAPQKRAELALPATKGMSSRVSPAERNGIACYLEKKQDGSYSIQIENNNEQVVKKITATFTVTLTLNGETRQMPIVVMQDPPQKITSAAIVPTADRRISVDGNAAELTPKAAVALTGQTNRSITFAFSNGMEMHTAFYRNAPGSRRYAALRVDREKVVAAVRNNESASPNSVIFVRVGTPGEETEIDIPAVPWFQDDPVQQKSWKAAAQQQKNEEVAHAASGEATAGVPASDAASGEARRHYVCVALPTTETNGIANYDRARALPVSFNGDKVRLQVPAGRTLNGEIITVLLIASEEE